MILNSRGDRLCERKCPAFREGSTGLCWCDAKMLYHGWDKPEYIIGAERVNYCNILKGYKLVKDNEVIHDN